MYVPGVNPKLLNVWPLNVWVLEIAVPVVYPTGTNNVIGTKNTEKGELTIIKEGAHPGIKVDLEPGDMLVYSGCELEHWREEFTGNICGQVFLHYNHLNGQFANNNLYDKRPLLGLPSTTKRV